MCQCNYCQCIRAILLYSIDSAQMLESDITKPKPTGKKTGVQRGCKNQLYGALKLQARYKTELIDDRELRMEYLALQVLSRNKKQDQYS